MDLIDIYYELSEIFKDDTDILVDAISKLTHTKYKKSIIKNKLSTLKLKSISYELNQLYDIKIETLKKFNDNKK